MEKRAYSRLPWEDACASKLLKMRRMMGKHAPTDCFVCLLSWVQIELEKGYSESHSNTLSLYWMNIWGKLRKIDIYEIWALENMIYTGINARYQYIYWHKCSCHAWGQRTECENKARSVKQNSHCLCLCHCLCKFFFGHVILLKDVGKRL